MVEYKAKKKGIAGILGIAQELFFVDRERNFMLDHQAFSTGLHRAKLELGNNEIDAIFDHLETSSRPGFVDYTHFIERIKGASIPLLRLDLLQEMFYRLDYKNSGVIDLRIMSNLFNPKNHYDVKGGRRTQDEIDNQFKDVLHIYGAICEGSNVVDYQGFLDFWSYLSPAILKDGDFETFVRNCFRYNELPKNPNLSADKRNGKGKARDITVVTDFKPQVDNPKTQT